MITLDEVLEENRSKYSSLIHLIEDFSISFKLTIQKLAKFLMINRFFDHTFAFVAINKTEYIQLDKSSSVKAVSFILNSFDDQKYDNSKLLDILRDDITEYSHIYIREYDLYDFSPLRQLSFEFCFGDDVLENVNLRDFDYKSLKKAENLYLKRFPPYGTNEWYEHYPKLQEIRDNPLPRINQIRDNPLSPIFESNLTPHPSQDINNSNHAPELIIAIEAWEAKYLHDEYKHQEHTPSITNILKAKNITGTNLVKRICAITNPNK